MNLFAYGTLMWPEVLEAVIGRRLQGLPATVQGYRRLRVKGEHYPVAVPSAGDSVEGVLYRNLTKADFEHLDRFEGVEYDRCVVCLGEEEAHLYVLSAEHRHIADTMPWRPEDLHAAALAAFCAEDKGWRSR